MPHSFNGANDYKQGECDHDYCENGEAKCVKSKKVIDYNSDVETRCKIEQPANKYVAKYDVSRKKESQHAPYGRVEYRSR